MTSLFQSIAIGAALMVLGGTAQAQVSVNIGQPGFYGRIDIGGAPPPRLIYGQPVIVERGRDYMRRPPIYLRVPAGYQRNWKRHCRAYDACGQRVYFVQDSWYSQQYMPHYRRHHGGPPPRHHGGPVRHDNGPAHHGGRNDRRDDHRGGRDDHRGGGRGEHRGDDRGHAR
jgi:hypothetical protein